jgi:uncharacterized damage-inducible protein DinB
MHWADAEVWRTVLASAAARNDATLRSLLLHLHVVQRAFLSLWTDAALTFPDVSEFPDVERLHAWAQPYYPDARAFLDGLDDEALARPVVMPWAEDLTKHLGRAPRTPTLGETIFQVTSHSTYHRGQVNARLRTVGGEPALVDYIAWIWFGRPSAAPV